MANTKVTSAVIADGAITPSKIASGDFYFDTNTLYIDSTNNTVGIGGTPTTYPLEVFDTNGNGIAFKDTTNSVTNFVGAYNSVGISGTLTNHAYALWTNNTERMRIDSSGNVGIGTSSPSSYQANADDLVVATSGHTGITIASGTSHLGNIHFADGTTGDDAYRGYIQYEHTSNYMRFATNAAEAMRIDSSGRVMINTTTPTNFQGDSSKLGIYDSTRATLSIQAGGYTNPQNAEIFLSGGIGDGGTRTEGWYIRGAGTGAGGNVQTVLDIIQSRADTDIVAARFDESGNVGIGTTSPSYKLTILENANNFLQFSQSGDSVVGSLIGRSSSTNLRIQNSENAATEFWTNNTERLRIDGAGNLLVGTTSSTLSGTDDGFVFHQDGNSSFVTGTGIMYMRRTTSNGTHIKFRSTTNATVGQIDSDGSNTSYVTSSDYRLKENVTYDFDALTRVQQLKPARFNFIEKPEVTQDGFLAHEVQDIVPIAVSGTKDEMETEEYEVTPAVLDEDGNVVTEAVMGTREIPKHQGIDHSKLVPLLTKAIQEQQTIIDDLKARIETLENA